MSFESACLVAAEVTLLQLSDSECFYLLVLCERAERRRPQLYLMLKSLLNWLRHSGGALLSRNLWKYAESCSLHQGS